jgi:hypothetical protein
MVKLMKLRKKEREKKRKKQKKKTKEINRERWWTNSEQDKHLEKGKKKIPGSETIEFQS